MAHYVKCATCRKFISLTASLAGAEARCPECGGNLRRQAEPDARPSAAEPDGPPPNPANLGLPRKGRGKGKKATRGKKSNAPLGQARIWPFAVGGAVLLVLMVIGGYFVLRGGGRGSDSDGGKDGRFAVVDAPVPPLPQVQPPAPAPRPRVRRRHIVRPRVVAVNHAPVAVVRPARPWAAGPDPSAAAPPALAANLGLNFTGFPLFAAGNGPFVIDVPVRYRLLYAHGQKNFKGFPTPPTPVLDLRTGKAVGTFTWKAPMWLGGFLSPDGGYLVGPDTAPTSPATENEGLLFVWKQGEEEPSARIKLAVALSWMDFVAPDRLAVQTFNPKPVLQVWNVARGEVVQTIPLPEQEFPATDVPSFRGVPPKLNYAPRPFHGAVSPGGRYVALGGRQGIVLVSLAWSFLETDGAGNTVQNLTGSDSFTTPSSGAAPWDLSTHNNLGLPSLSATSFSFTETNALESFNLEISNGAEILTGTGSQPLADHLTQSGPQGIGPGADQAEPLRRVHECVFGVLALESEPVDPRL